MQPLDATEWEHPRRLSIYGDVEQVTQITSNSGTAYSDYAFIMCLDRGGFNNIPHIIKYSDQSMIFPEPALKQ